MGYDEQTKRYRPWNDDKPEEFEQFTEISLDGAGVTDADVSAMAERLRFPKLKRLSLLNNTLTSACLSDIAKIYGSCPDMTHLLLPDNLYLHLSMGEIVEELENS